MRLKDDNTRARDLAGSQAAQLLREGRLGALLVDRAAAQTSRHRSAVSAGGTDQAAALRRAVRALESSDSGAAGVGTQAGPSPEAAA